MMTLSHTGGSLLLEDDTASAVVRYSMALAGHREMSTVTLEDAGTPAPHAQVLLVVGMGVALSVRAACGDVGASDGVESGDDLDVRTAALNAPQNAVMATEEEARRDAAATADVDSYFDLL
ncbi:MULTISPECIES: hypothetical protein [unclassified Rathayibacter]|uniref:hypothetical protein n=1 Tax=unclassified Rathayibacter TaxID=2609250 RepID=UPI0006F6B686|nr:MULTISPECIES: hypothetical protein [unclassified Rathayibacter]KQQ03595.1 hypothetical protein ASF42_08855 [Rathayibacter sp. Leaf294]KQS12051.1 hypothetical protein ASG06_08855 [Rathayibacter sp. Leaf185]